MNTSDALKQIEDIPQPLVWEALAFVPGFYVLFPLLLVYTLALWIGTALTLFAIFYFSSNSALGMQALGLSVGLFIALVYGIVIALRAFLKPILDASRHEMALLIHHENEPEFFSFVQDLCTQMGVQLPDHLVLHGGSQFMMMEGRLRVLNGLIRGRILVLGLPMISFLTQNQLRSILAHEMAHFMGRDTLYSALVFPLYISANEALRVMRKIVADTQRRNLFNRLFFFLPSIILRWYLNTFHQLNLRLSRLREYRADRVAAAVCGSARFAEGLQLVVDHAAAFQEFLLAPAIVNKQADNFYKVFRNFVTEFQPRISHRIKKDLSVREDPLQEHPPLQARLSALPAIEAGADNSVPADRLFQHLESYEQVMSDHYMRPVLKLMEDQRAILLRRNINAPKGHAGESARTSAGPRASFGERFVALYIDIMIVAIPVMIVQLIWGESDIGLMLSFFVLWMYFAGLESSPLQATLGKRIIGLKVTDLKGYRIGFWRASYRILLKFFILAGWLINILDFLFRTRVERANFILGHDDAAGTVVIRKDRKETMVTTVHSKDLETSYLEDQDVKNHHQRG